MCVCVLRITLYAFVHFLHGTFSRTSDDGKEISHSFLLGAPYVIFPLLPAGSAFPFKGLTSGSDFILYPAHPVHQHDLHRIVRERATSDLILLLNLLLRC
jgi:hypothetical protein